MKILIEMPTEHYDSLLSKCRDAWLAEYATLRKGVITVRQTEGREQQQVAILCETHQARNLLVIARSLNSPAVEDIRRALGYPPEH